MKKISCFLFIFSYVLAQGQPGIKEPDFSGPVTRIIPPDERQVREIAGFLSDKPAGFGDPCHKRDIWDRLLKSGKYDLFLKQMESFSFPPFSKEDYFSLSDGTAPSSVRGLAMMRNRAKGLSQLTWAECLENKGRYIKATEDGLQDIIDQKSWVSPRADFGFINYNGIEYTIDLTTVLYAHTIAQTLYLLSDKLSPEIRKRALEALYKRVFDPLLKNFEKRDRGHNVWLTGTNNQNAVCLSGVVGAALTVIEDKYERARFAYIGALYSYNALAGFGDDGYCSEGVGYYNYGFEHYMLLRENILKATNGKIDLFNRPKVSKIAQYPFKIAIINGLYPAISDSRTGIKPDAGLMSYLSRNLSLGLTEFDTLSFEGKTNNLCRDVMLAFYDTVLPAGAASASKEDKEGHLRSFFEKSVVLVARPKPGSSGKIGVAIKGGNNKEHHNHNDVGSYTIAVGNEILFEDPGLIPYTADIFRQEFRYTYKTIASYGHPVPLVAGSQQRPGPEARAIMLQTDFTEETDVFSIDISSAYEVRELQKLVRTFTYDRKDEGRLAVSDIFEFSVPQDFETALITRATWRQLPSGQLLLERGMEKLIVTIDCQGKEFRLHSEQIGEGGEPYTRIAVALEQPASSGKITLTYSSGQ